MSFLKVPSLSKKKTISDHSALRMCKRKKRKVRRHGDRVLANTPDWTTALGGRSRPL